MPGINEFGDVLQRLEAAVYALASEPSAKQLHAALGNFELPPDVSVPAKVLEAWQELCKLGGSFEHVRGFSVDERRACAKKILDLYAWIQGERAPRS